MDGYKIRAKIALNFPKPVNNTESEDIMMQYARAFAAAVESELSNGDLPFEEHELFQRITDQVTVLPRKNVRLIGLHIWHKGAISSRSMLAVKPEGGGAAAGNPTVPAMQAVSPNAHTATTVKPPEKTASPSASAPQRPSMPSQAAVSQPPGARSVSPPATARSTSTGAPPSSRVTTPAMPAQRAAAPMPGIPSRPAASPAVSGTRYSAGAARTQSPAAPSAKPAAFSPAAAPTAAGAGQSAAFPAAARMVSGVVPAVEPRIVRSKSGFAMAVEACAGDSAEDLGRGLAQPIRDSAADVLFATLGALHGVIPDPLALLDGRCDEELRRSLIGEACVYVCYVLYEGLTRTSLPQMQSILVVQGACIHALMDQNMPVSELSRYLATESPREEFAGRVCALFGARETPEMQQRVEAHLRALRIDVRSCTEQIEQRLLRGKARSEQKTG